MIPLNCFAFHGTGCRILGMKPLDFAREIVGLMKDEGENMRLWEGKELSSWQSVFEPEHHL